jgi:hypothetical protein
MRAAATINHNPSQETGLARFNTAATHANYITLANQQGLFRLPQIMKWRINASREFPRN